MNEYTDPRGNTYSLFEFYERFDSNEACEQEIFRLKWPDGFECPKCGGTHYSVVRGRRLPLYQCSSCHKQTTAIAGTIFECTKLPLIKWFLALFFVATNKDGISEMALSKYIGVTLKTAWSMLQKIRTAMGGRECLYKLGGSVEMDETYFGGKRKGKRGRGSENKTLVGVALQLTETGAPQYLKMKVIPDAKGRTLKSFAIENIEQGSVVHSDALASYNSLQEDYTTDMQKYDPKDENGRLKWLHVMISNIKANIEGAYHGLEGTYLQRYLDEFCYRFNRRWSKRPVLDHLVECCVWAPFQSVAEVRI